MIELVMLIAAIVMAYVFYYLKVRREIQELRCMNSKIIKAMKSVGDDDDCV